MKGRRELVRTRRRTCSDFIVRITNNNGITWQGKVEHVQSGQVQHFRSCIELFRLLQQKLDETGRPQSAMEIRSWSDGARECLFKGEKM